MRVLLASVLVIACSKPIASEPHVAPDPVDASSKPAPAPQHSAAFDAPWMSSCSNHLAEAVAEAGQHSPAMAGIPVEKKVFTNGFGAEVEELTLYRMGFMLRVEKKNPPDTDGDDAWHMRAESLKGSYHRTEMRHGPRGWGSFSFDGVPVAAAVELSPIFRRAIDRCLG